MRKSLKAVHILGLASFLGSISVYIALATQHVTPGTPEFGELRAQILLATRIITVPGLTATVVSGFALLWLNRREMQRWQIVKAIVGCLLLVNTWLLVGPAIRGAAELSGLTILSPGRLDELNSALRIEAISGGVNVSLAFLAIWLALFRPALRRRQDSGPVLDDPVSTPEHSVRIGGLQ